MEVTIAVSKINKYATSQSGDTVEAIERPSGGLSVVLADGQSSGRGAKHISMLVVRKVIALLAEGVRDGAAARAASDSLFTEKAGKVSSTLNILSVDQRTNTLVITRNNPAPVIVVTDDMVKIFDEECLPIGLYRDTRPTINEISLVPGLVVFIFSDGIIHAGSRSGKSIDITSRVSSLVNDRKEMSPQELADTLMEEALELDQNRPVDDISVVVLKVTGKSEDLIRRMNIRLPL